MTSDYERIAKAIAWITEQADAQPTLDQIAEQVNLSPYHFQRLFRRWAGISPKRFLQALTLERSKYLLDDARSLLDVADAVGLSGAARLHDHFVHLEGVTPGEYKNRGRGLQIDYGTHATPFGEVFVAATERGITRLDFIDDGDTASRLQGLGRQWPDAVLVANAATTGERVAAAFAVHDSPREVIPLQVTGTNFQIAVWRALLRIPPGRFATYSRIAEALGRPKAARAVGNAVGANPVAFLIPCHRVILQSGAVGGYHWGRTRKQAMQARELATHAGSAMEGL